MQYNTGIESDYNIFYRERGPMIQRDTISYAISQFSDYKSNLEQDGHSVSADPLFLDPLNGKFQLQSESPAIDAGIDVGLHADFNETPVPQGQAVDVGAYEFSGSTERMKVPKSLKIFLN
jgi:hypothetical protein